MKRHGNVSVVLLDLLQRNKMQKPTHINKSDILRIRNLFTQECEGYTISRERNKVIMYPKALKYEEGLYPYGVWWYGEPISEE